MSIPDYQTLMLPLLQLASDGQEHAFRKAVEQLAEQFNLSDQELTELLPSGTQTVFANRVGWARTYLKQAGLLLAPRRGVFLISEAGQKLLEMQPVRVDNVVLGQYESFRQFRFRGRLTDGSTQPPSQPQAGVTARESSQDERVPEQTPEDAMAAAYGRLRREREAELLEQVKSASPAFFERLVVDLLVAMGYGGSRQDAGRAIGKSGDGGIDGIIKEDRLGLDVIYVQAKRWQGSVGRPEVQKFAGALAGQRASKGVFVTTSNFTKEAEEFVEVIATKIILIGGEQLASLLFDHNVGVTRVGGYEIKRVDTDYFEDD